MPLGTLGNGPTITSPHLVTQKLLGCCEVHRESDPDRNQSSKYYLEALSAFGYFGKRSYNYKSPPGYSKTFWLLRGPSGIGSGPQIKV